MNSFHLWSAPTTDSYPLDSGLEPVNNLVMECGLDQTREYLHMNIQKLSGLNGKLFKCRRCEIDKKKYDADRLTLYIGVLRHTGPYFNGLKPK